MKCVPLNSQNLFIWTLIFILTLYSFLGEGSSPDTVSWNQFGNWKVPAGLMPGFNLRLDFLLLLFPWARSFSPIASCSYPWPAIKLGHICTVWSGHSLCCCVPIHALYTYQGCFLRVQPLNFINVPKIELFQPV